MHILHIRLSFGIVHFIKNILNDIKDHSMSSRNRNRGNRGNIKSLQRGPSMLKLCFLQPDLRLTEWVTLPARVSAHAPQLLLSPSHYFRSDLMENTTSKSLLEYKLRSTSRGSPTHYPRWYPCKSQPAKANLSRLIRKSAGDRLSDFIYVRPHRRLPWRTVIRPWDKRTMMTTLHRDWHTHTCTHTHAHTHTHTLYETVACTAWYVIYMCRRTYFVWYLIKIKNKRSVECGRIARQEESFLWQEDDQIIT